MKLWAKALDPDFPHSERVAHLSLQLYDSLESTGLLNRKQQVPHVSPHSRGMGRSQVSDGVSRNGNPTRDSARASLYLAALLHDVGKSKGNKGHHKESLELIKAHGTPLGWEPENMARAAVVARFHCGALPTRSHKVLRELMPDEQQDYVIQLAAILRLANALDAAHDGHIRRIKIENRSHASQRSGQPKPTDSFASPRNWRRTRL